MLTTQDITDVVNTLCSTKEEFAGFMQQSAISMQIRQLDKAIEALATEQQVVLAPVQNRRIELQNQKAALVAQLAS